MTSPELCVSDAFKSHALYYLDVLHGLNGAFLAREPYVRERLRLDWAQILEAQAWTARNRETSDEIATLCSNFAGISQIVYYYGSSRLWQLWNHDGIAAAQQLRNPRRESAHRTHLGQAYVRDGKFDAAYDSLLRALEIENQFPPTESDSGYIHGFLSRVARKLNRLDDARRHAEAARDFALVGGPPCNLTRAYFELAQICLATEDFKAAEMSFKAALEAAQCPHCVADVNEEWGRLWGRLGRLDLAAECLEVAVQNYSEINLFERAASVRKTLAYAYSNAGQFENSARHLRLALRSLEQGEFDLLPDSTDQHFELGMGTEELRSFERECTSLLAEVLLVQNKHQEALTLLQTAVHRARRLMDPIHLVRILNYFGTSQSNLGQVRAAIQSHHEALALATAEKNTAEIQDSENGLGLALLYSNNFPLACETFQAAVAHARDLQLLDRVFSAAVNWGISLRACHRLEAAEHALSVALVHVDHADPYWAAMLYGELSVLNADLRELDLVHQYSNRALEASQQLQNPNRRGHIIQRCAEAMFTVNDMQAAQTLYQEVIKLLSPQDDIRLLAPAYVSLGNVYKATRQTTDAVEALNLAWRAYVQCLDLQSAIKVLDTLIDFCVTHALTPELWNAETSKQALLRRLTGQ